MTEAKNLGAPYELLRRVAAEPASCRCRTSRAGGIATPADAALMMQLGAEAVFVGSGIFKSARSRPRARGRSSRRPRTTRIPTCWPRSAEDLGEAMPGIETSSSRSRTSCRREAGSGGKFDTLPAGLPVPVDDGATTHLPGATVPAVTLPATSGRAVDLRRLGRARPGCSSSIRAPGRRRRSAGPESTPSPARAGCTPQSCGSPRSRRGLRASRRVRIAA